MLPFTLYPTRRHLLLAVPLAFFLALPLALFSVASRHEAVAADPFIGRVMPCGHVYQGRSEVKGGDRWFVCVRGDRWPQLSGAPQFDAAPVPTPLPVERPMPMGPQRVWIHDGIIEPR